jgi:hypothetical protein
VTVNVASLSAGLIDIGFGFRCLNQSSNYIKFIENECSADEG